MLWTIIAIVVSGLGAAGIALLLRKLSRNTLPKWIIPVFAGLGMLGYQITYEYSWYDHQVERQPAGTVVVATEDGQVFWRPWTYHFPMTVAFTVLDTRNIVQREAGDDRLAEFILYRFEKQHIDVVTPQAYVLNCSTRELLPISSRQEPVLSALKRIEADSPLYRHACRL